ncbi:MAG: TlpA family protein disulfide reductase [Bdellovibrionia bacterium]
MKVQRLRENKRVGVAAGVMSVLGGVGFILGAVLLNQGAHSKVSLRSKPLSPSQEGASLRSAPGFELMDSQGKTHTLSKLKGSAVLLHFWASWCPPCLEEIPQWLSLVEQMQGSSLQFVAVSLDSNWSDAQKILPPQPSLSHFVSLLDPSGQVPDRYGSFQFPETYLLNSELKIVQKWVGPQPWDQPEFQKALRRWISDQNTPS